MRHSEGMYVIMQIKAVNQYIPVLPFMMLKGILNFQPGLNPFKSDHSKESY